MKKFFSVLFTLLFSFSLFAAQGPLWGEKNIKMVSTEWFDIIYPESCVEGAKLLFENADDIYRSIANMYGRDITVRIPVTLTSSVELYNAYYSSSYYNRIVLYVAPPAEECNVESDNLLKTFHHELTHAYTYNLKNGFWRFVGKVLGDPVNVSYFLVTPGMAEGATVTSESADGEGRLNDEYAKQYVKQAKIEGKFPAFNDVQGSRDIYPTGSFYYFNGAFHEWLQNNYGMDKYAEWWFRCVNFKSITIRRAFKKVYGYKLLEAWSQFKVDYPVPNVPANPVKSEYVKDFFTPNSMMSIYNAQGGLPTSLSVSDKGLTYLDDKNSSVYFVSAADFEKEIINPRKLFTDNYTEAARQSKDGKYIAVSTYINKDATYRYYVHIYDTENKSWFNLKESGIKDASIIQRGNDYYLVALKFKGEDWKIRITKLEITNGKVKGEGTPIYIDYNRKQLPGGFVDCQNGTFAYILKDKMDYSICVADLKGKVLNKIDAPYERMVIRYPSFTNGELYFSWTQPGSMPRLGKYNFVDSTFALSQEDFSGGVYYPTKVNDRIIYSGQFYTSNKIFTMDDLTKLVEPFNNTNLELNQIIADSLSDSSENGEDLSEAVIITESFETSLLQPAVGMINQSTDYTFDPQVYNPLRFYTRGLLIPMSEVESEAYDPKHAEAKFPLPIGITYYSSNPWGSDMVGLSTGYSYMTNSAGYNITFNAGTDTSLMTYSFTQSSEFDRYGWKQSNANISVGSTIKFGHTSTVVIQPQAKFHAGRSSASEEEAKARTKELAETDSEVLTCAGIRIGEYESIDMTNYIYHVEQLNLYYKNIRYVDDSPLGKAGLIVGVSPYFMYNATMDKSEVYTKVGDISFFALGYIPKLIPIKCVEGKVYNLPTKIMAGLFSASSIGESLSKAYYFPDFGYVNFETALYSQQIQKAIPGLPFLFINDFRICLSGIVGADYTDDVRNQSWRFLHMNDYITKIRNEEFETLASLTLKIVAGTVPTNFGMLATSSIKQDVFLGMNLIFSDEGAVPKFSFGIDTSF